MAQEVANNFLSKKEEEAVVQAIRKAEKHTSGEIKVFIDNYSFERPKKTAKRLFYKLGLHKTRQRNGILLLVMLQPKKFVILGDSGIDQVVPKDYWRQIKNEVVQGFKQKDYGNALVKAVEEVGIKLQHYFPYQQDDINELSDEIGQN